MAIFQLVDAESPHFAARRGRTKKRRAPVRRNVHFYMKVIAIVAVGVALMLAASFGVAFGS